MRQTCHLTLRDSVFSKLLNFFFNATSWLPAVLQWDTAKQTYRRADDTNTLKFLSPLPVDFLLLLPTTQHTSRCLSLCYLGVWPSCSCGSTLKVTLCTHRHCLSLPHHHQPHCHTHTHTHTCSISPRPCQRYTAHRITNLPTVCLCKEDVVVNRVGKPGQVTG